MVKVRMGECANCMNLAQFGISCGKQVLLAERDVCYEVLNGKDFDVTPQIKSYGKRFCSSRQEFEASVIACFGTCDLKWV
jgi:hypothetical protein